MNKDDNLEEVLGLNFAIWILGREIFPQKVKENRTSRILESLAESQCCSAGSRHCSSDSLDKPIYHLVLVEKKKKKGTTLGFLCD